MSNFPEIECEPSAFDYRTLPWGSEISFPNTRSTKQYTHRVFNRYPARSINLVPRSILSSLDRSAFESINVIDPFMGSGTTAIEASLLRMNAFGVELDPFAKLISDVSTRGINKKQKYRLLETFNIIVRKWKTYGVDEMYAPELPNIRYWFSNYVFDQLLKLKKAIYLNTNQNDLSFFKIVFADIIRPCSLAERQSLKPYISKKHAKIPSDVQETFIKSFQSHYKAVLEYSEFLNFPCPSINWVGENAVKFSTTAKMDVAITSPPYINALDYFRCIKLESSWIDCYSAESMKLIKMNQVGDLKRVSIERNTILDSIISEIYSDLLKKDTLRAVVFYKYFSDMYKNLLSVRNVLKSKASYHIIVGNSKIRGIEIETHSILASIAEQIGFRFTNYYKYKIRDHRLSIPRKDNGGKIEYEHVISLTKQ